MQSFTGIKRIIKKDNKNKDEPNNNKKEMEKDLIIEKESEINE